MGTKQSSQNLIHRVGGFEIVLTFRHAGFASASSAAFDKELKVVPGTETLHHVRVKQRSVQSVLLAFTGVHASLDVKRAKTPKQPARAHNIFFLTSVKLSTLITHLGLVYLITFNLKCLKI